MVVQCKSKGLQHDSRIGRDVEAILNDVRKAVVEAFEQGIGARSYLMGSEEPVFYCEAGSGKILRSAITSIFLLTVTTLPLQFLTTRLANSQSVRDLFSGYEFPWALSLPDLDTLTEVLQTPERFLHYARRRVQVERTAYSLLGDEMDLLGLYLSGHLNTDPTEFEGFDGVMISGLSGGVDEYIWRKHDLGENVKPPVPTISAEFAKLIEDLCATGCFGATDCALTLLDQSGRQHQQLVEAIAEARQRFLANGKMQRVSAIVAQEDVGVSFLIMDASADPENLGHQLEGHALVQKYAERCHTWVAMASDGASSRTVDLCMFLCGPWEEDEVLEELADKHIGIRARKARPSETA
jgi:hypothetical protein